MICNCTENVNKTITAYFNEQALPNEKFVKMRNLYKEARYHMHYSKQYKIFVGSLPVFIIFLVILIFCDDSLKESYNELNSWYKALLILLAIYCAVLLPLWLYYCDAPKEYYIDSYRYYIDSDSQVNINRDYHILPSYLPSYIHINNYYNKERNKKDANILEVISQLISYFILLITIIILFTFFLQIIFPIGDLIYRYTTHKNAKNDYKRGRSIKMIHKNGIVTMYIYENGEDNVIGCFEI